MPVGKELGKLDLVSLATVFNRRDDLNRMLAEEDNIANNIGEHIELLIPHMLHPYSNRLSVGLSVLEQSLFSLLSHRSDNHPTLKDCRKANWILAANIGTMREGHPLEPFIKIYKREWTPVAMVNGYEDYTYFGTHGDTYVFMSLAGYTATEEFRKFIPRKGGGRWFVHKAMFELPSNRYAFYNPKEELQPIDAPLIYMDMYTWALIDPNCEHGAPFERAECTPSFQEHNRKLFHARHKDCLYGRECACTQCVVGLEKCAQATHRGGTYVSKHCAHCHEMGLFKDEEETETVCLKCRHELFLKRKRGATRHRKDDDGHEREAEGVGTLVQSGEGSIERVAGNPDEGGGIRS